MKIKCKCLLFVLLSGLVAAVCVWGLILQNRASEINAILEKLDSPEPEVVRSAARSIRGLQYEMLEDGTRQMVRTPGYEPFRGRAARKIERRVIERLADIEDRLTLQSLLSVVMRSHGPEYSETGLDFQRYGNAEWGVIRKASEKVAGSHFYFEHEDGTRGIGIGGHRGQSRIIRE